MTPAERDNHDPASWLAERLAAYTCPFYFGRREYTCPDETCPYRKSHRAGTTKAMRDQATACLLKWASACLLKWARDEK